MISFILLGLFIISQYRQHSHTHYTLCLNPKPSIPTPTHRLSGQPTVQVALIKINSPPKKYIHGKLESKSQLSSTFCLGVSLA